MEHFNFITGPQLYQLAYTHVMKKLVLSNQTEFLSGQNLSLAGQMTCLLTRIICRLARVFPYGTVCEVSWPTSFRISGHCEEAALQ